VTLTFELELDKMNELVKCLDERLHYLDN